MFQNLQKLRFTGTDTVKPGLRRITEVLEKLGNPQRKKDYLAVGGTNGKGSVATFLTSIFESSGFRVGLFTSPHILNVTERIKIGEEEIPPKCLDEILGEIFSVCKTLGTDLSYFELLTVAAFLHFKASEIDMGVLEVGMGGRWDSVNVCDHIACVITNVSLDHTEYLGTTIPEIAVEKAGIIKKNSLVITGCEGEALEIIEKTSTEHNAICLCYGQDFIYKENKDKSFNYLGLGWEIQNLRTSLEGNHQIKNAIISTAVAELLSIHTKYKTTPENIKKALYKVKLPGRMEYISTEPTVIIDVAHNPAAAEKLVESLESCHPNTKFNFLFTMLENKDVSNFSEAISRICGKLIITELKTEKRSLKVEKIFELLQGQFDSVEMARDPLEAYRKLLSYGEPCCICGSFYLLGYLGNALKHEKTISCDQ